MWTSKPVEDLISFCSVSIQDDISALTYLRGRGASESQISVHRIGALPSSFRLDPESDLDHDENCTEASESCTTCRLNHWVSRHNKSKSLDGLSSSSVIFPLTSPSGIIYGLQARSIEKKVFDTFMVKDRPEAVFFGAAANSLNIFQGRTVVITEGPMDMLVVERNTGLPTLALTTNSLSRHQSKYVARIANRIVIVLDGDEAGRNGAKSIIHYFGRDADCIDVRLDKLDKTCKDPNELWSKHGDKKLAQFFKQAIARAI